MPDWYGVFCFNLHKKSVEYKILIMKKATKEKADLGRSDVLAIQRTQLANERTFLAYFRSAIVFLSSGLAIMKMAMLQEITGIGYFFMVLAPILFIIGFARFFYVKRQLKKAYYKTESEL